MGTPSVATGLRFGLSPNRRPQARTSAATSFVGHLQFSCKSISHSQLSLVSYWGTLADRANPPCPTGYSHASHHPHQPAHQDRATHQRVRQPATVPYFSTSLVNTQPSQKKRVSFLLDVPKAKSTQPGGVWRRAWRQSPTKANFGLTGTAERMACPKPPRATPLTPAAVLVGV